MHALKLLPKLPPQFLISQISLLTPSNLKKRFSFLNFSTFKKAFQKATWTYFVSNRTSYVMPDIHYFALLKGKVYHF